MNKQQLLLAKFEAATIVSALCTMNNLGAPMFSTAIHRPKNFLRGHDETIVFQWQENDAGACEITIFSSVKTSHGVRTTYTSDEAIEHYGTQNDFMKAYGLTD